MTDMREIVARAIYATRDPKSSDPWDVAMERSGRYSGSPPPMVGEALIAADAALAAIREELAKRVPERPMHPQEPLHAVDRINAHNACRARMLALLDGAE